MAVNEHKKIIPIIIDSVELTPGMQLQLGLCQMLNTQQFSKERINGTIMHFIKKRGKCL